MEKRKAQEGGSSSRSGSGNRDVRLRRRLKFAVGDPADRSSNFYIEVKDLDGLTDELLSSTWLLITGPWQSGKSSLMYRLSERVQDNSCLSVITTLSEEMVLAANDPCVSDMAACEAFFRLLAREMVRGSGGRLVYGGESGWDGILEMLAVKEHQQEEIVWFIDEASYLNEVQRSSILRTLLGGLRVCKHHSNAATRNFRLRSFVLIGTEKVSRLLKNARMARIEAVKGGKYVVSSPDRRSPFDSFYPLSGSSISPLSLQIQRTLDTFEVEDVVQLLQQYRQETGVVFLQSLDDKGLVDEKRQGAVILKFARSILSMTNGHKGMVGCCCGYLATRKELTVYTEWKRRVRLGCVAAFVFYGRAYSQMTSNLPDYSEGVQEVILRCVTTGSSVTIGGVMVEEMLPPINDGLLRKSGARVALASNLLLQAMLEDLRMAPRAALPQVHSFNDALRSAFAFLNVTRLQNVEALNANGQPSEYMWQSEILLSSKFVLDNCYRESNYSVLVEAKQKKNGRLRLDFLYKNSVLKGCEVQGAGDEESIKKHIIKSDEKYRVLYGCEMHYVYIQFGEAPACAVRDPKAVIARESKGRELTCWFVKYLPAEHAWVVERLEGSEWMTSRVVGALNYPEFMLGCRRDNLYTSQELYA